MARGSDAGRGECQFAGLALAQRHQVLGAFHRQVVVYQENRAGVAEDRDRREIADRMILEARIERDVRRQRARRIGHHQRIAIRRRVNDLLDRDGAAGAGAVIDHDGLACGSGDAIEHHPGDDVGYAGCRKRNHHLDDLPGVVQRIGVANGDRQKENRKYAQPERACPCHGALTIADNYTGASAVWRVSSRSAPSERIRRRCIGLLRAGPAQEPDRSPL